MEAGASELRWRAYTDTNAWGHADPESDAGTGNADTDTNSGDTDTDTNPDTGRNADAWGVSVEPELRRRDSTGTACGLDIDSYGSFGPVGDGNTGRHFT